MQGRTNPGNEFFAHAVLDGLMWGGAVVMANGFRPPLGDLLEDTRERSDEQANQGKREKYDHHSGDCDADALTVDYVLNIKVELQSIHPSS